MQLPSFAKKTFYLPCILFLSLLFFSFFHSFTVVAEIDKTINIHGKLTNDDGTNISSLGCNGDGTCDFRFDVYDVSTGGSSLLSGKLTYSDIEVVDGIFSVKIDFTGNESVFEGAPRWIELEVDMGGDGFGGVGTDDMFGRVRMSAVPYAFNAMNLDGISGSGFVQIAPSVVQEDISTSAMVFLNKSGASGNILQLQKSGSDVFVIDNSGNVGIGASTPSTKLDVAGGMILSGTNNYLNFNTTVGELGYGFRDNAGVMEFKNASGEWTPFGSGGGSGFITVNPTVQKVKTVNQLINNSSTLVDDSELNFSIGANETWIVRITVFGATQSNAYFKFALTAPTGSACSYAGIDPEGETTTLQVTTCGTAIENISGSGVSDVYELVGVVTSGATGGTVTFQWAQGVARKSDAIVYAGSYVTAYMQVDSSEISKVFTQGGNSFGEIAVLGTNDDYGLSFLTNNTERVIFDNLGNVGIGVTSPTYRLDIYDTQASSFVSRVRNGNTDSTAGGLVIQLGPTSNPTSSNNFIEFRDGDGDVVGRIIGNGSGGISYQTSGADYAEYFIKRKPARQTEAEGQAGGVKSEELKVEEYGVYESGMIVSIGDDGLVETAVAGDDPLGVVSSAPGFVGGMNSGSAEESVLVGLNGQILTYILHTEMEGEINKTSNGDKIAVSPINGIGWKMNNRGYSLGTVIEDKIEELTKERCIVVEDIAQMYEYLEAYDIGQLQCLYISSSGLSPEVITQLGEGITGLYITKAKVYVAPKWAELVEVVEQVTEYVENIEGISLAFGDYFSVEENIINTEYSISAVNFKGVEGIFDVVKTQRLEVADAKFVVDELGNVMIGSGLSVLGKSTFESDVEFKGSVTFSSQNAGYAKIISGDTNVEVIFELPFKDTPVIVVESNEPALIYRVIEKSNNGFKIQLLEPKSTDVSFSWIALQVENPVEYSSR